MYTYIILGSLIAIILTCFKELKKDYFDLIILWFGLMIILLPISTLMIINNLDTHDTISTYYSEPNNFIIKSDTIPVNFTYKNDMLEFNDSKFKISDYKKVIIGSETKHIRIITRFKYSKWVINWALPDINIYDVLVIGYDDYRILNLQKYEKII